MITDANRKPRDYNKCPRCKKDILFDCSEIENNMCHRCTDKEISHSNERREWNYYHNEG